MNDDYVPSDPDNGGQRNKHGREDRRRARRADIIGELRGDDSTVALPTSRGAVTVPATRKPLAHDVPEIGTEDTAFLYIRVSTREQARTGGGEEGYSIPSQRAACVEKAKQLGAIVTGVYIDAGESAKTTQRPELQRMLADVRGQRPRYIIVHKIDRLARNRADDIAINMALRKAGAELVSCMENISDTPSGKFLYNIMADMAQFYSDNLAQEVMKGMGAMARDGGTPTRAPIGYLHCREPRDGVMAAMVILDPERAPLVSWAFKQYATGDWTVDGLAAALREKGLTTRPGPKTPAREVGKSGTQKMLSNPYYMGVVTFQGATHPGKHEALVDAETWLQVQDVLAMRAHRGEKERKHPHYLRGTIYCGTCGERLVYTQATGRRGITYSYFGCIKKRLSGQHCPAKVIRVEKIEDGIADLYQRIQLPEAEVSRLRRAVRGELANQTADAHEHAERAHRRLAQLTDERAKLLRAHYDGAIPADLLKSEMDRLTRGIASSDREASFAQAEIADVEQLLDQALAIAGSCWLHYYEAPAKIRRQMNQGFFEKLWIEQDGSVMKAELTEPFQALVDGRARRASETEKDPLPSTEDGPSGVTGLQKDALVELRGFEPLTP